MDVDFTIPKVTIKLVGANEPVFAQADKPNNISLKFSFEGRENIKKIEITQFVSVTLAGDMTLGELRKSKSNLQMRFTIRHDNRNFFRSRSK